MFCDYIYIYIFGASRTVHFGVSVPNLCIFWKIEIEHWFCTTPAAILRPETNSAPCFVILQWIQKIWCHFPSFSFSPWCWDRFALFACSAAGHGIYPNVQCGRAKIWPTPEPIWQRAMQSWRRAPLENSVDFREMMVQYHPPLNISMFLPRGIAPTKIQPAAEWSAQKKSSFAANVSNDSWHSVALIEKMPLTSCWCDRGTAQNFQVVTIFGQGHTGTVWGNLQFLTKPFPLTAASWLNLNRPYRHHLHHHYVARVGARFVAIFGSFRWRRKRNQTTCFRNLWNLKSRGGFQQKLSP